MESTKGTATNDAKPQPNGKEPAIATPLSSPPMRKESQGVLPANSSASSSSVWNKLKGFVHSPFPTMPSVSTATTSAVPSEEEKEGIDSEPDDQIFAFEEEPEKPAEEDKDAPKQEPKEEEVKVQTKGSALRSFLSFGATAAVTIPTTAAANVPTLALSQANVVVVSSPPKKEEPKGSINISFSTIFSESFNIAINASSPDQGVLENIQKTLSASTPLVIGSPPFSGQPTTIPPEGEPTPRRERSNSGSGTQLTRVSEEEGGIRISTLRASSDKFNPLVSPPMARAGPKGATPMIKELKILATAPFDFILTKYPTEISSFLTLQKLSIERASLKDIPPSIGQLISLQYLHLVHNSIRSMPDQLRSLTALTYLNLSANQLVSIPNIGSLSKLELLDLHSNLLSSLPDLTELTSLKALFINHNKLGSLPIGIMRMSGLQQLDASYNVISKTKKGIEIWTNLTELVSLHLQCNKITALSASLGCLTSLTEMDVSNNLLTAIPTGIGNLTGLTKLDVSHNGLVNLPHEVDRLTRVKHFHLSYNKLTALVPMQSLTSLTELNASHNALTTLSELPSSLLHLILSFNELTTVPVHFAQLSSLWDLDLSHNKITTLHPEMFTDPPGFLTLKNLNLSSNHLQLLIPEIGKLPNIRQLDLSENVLISMPIEIKNLTTLESLFLHSTKVMVLPKALPLSLVELSLANISINKPNEKVEILYQDTNLKHQLSMLIHCTRSVQHPLTVFALGNYFTKTAEYRDILLHQGALNDFFSFITSGDPSIRTEATRALANVLEFSEGIEGFINESHLDIIMGLITGNYDLDTRCHAVRCIGNVSFNEQVKALLFTKYSLDQFIKMHQEATELPMKTAFNKLLNILGAQDYLHFPPERKRGLRILTMDGGGMRALVTLEVLKRIEEITGQKITDLFDLIVGTSTGGILASLVGIRQYSLDTCEVMYKDFGSKVFLVGSNPNSEPAAWSKLFNYTNMLKSGAFYKAETLMDILSKKCGVEPMIDSTMTDSGSTIKVAFVSTLISVSPPEPYLFRNYNYPAAKKSRYMGDCRTLVYHALRASTAAPSYFDPYPRNDKEVFSDGALIANNPAAIAIHEAKSLWPGRPIECVVSLGTGSPSSKPVKVKGFLQTLMKTLVRAATSPRPIHDVLTDILDENQYFRFNPIGDAVETGLDETNEERLRAVQEATRKYLDENSERVHKMCQVLMNPKMS